MKYLCCKKKITCSRVIVKNTPICQGTKIGWKKIIWFNESRFTLFQHDESIRVRRERHEPLKHSTLHVLYNYTSRKRKCYDLSLLLLGWFIQKQQHYAAIKWNQLTIWEYWMTKFIPAVDFFFVADTSIFQTKIARIHWAQIGKDCFKGHQASFVYMNWPL